MTNFDDKSTINDTPAKDGDKTRVVKNETAANDKPNASNTEALDKTRITPVTPDAPDNDNTRVSPHNTAANDKTRVAPSNPAPASDATLIKTQLKAGDNEHTRIDPSSGRSKIDTTIPDPISSLHQESPAGPGEGRILKERFVLEKVLGEGGMGIVFKARDLLKVEANDRDPYVAIKVLGEEFKAHPESFIALQRESRKSQRIAHHNIVNVYDFDRDGDTVFMTMEYMEGKPLDELIHQYKSTGLPSDDAYKVLDGICSALMYAHNEKIVHSDFKPGNVFVTTRGIAKVFDFGIARAVAQVEQHEDSAQQDKTLFDAGNLGALTPAYASKEMLEGKTPDTRDDIYAVGCVAYELFTGEHPFNKIPADEAFKQGLKPKRITSIPKRHWQAIEKALAFNREGRIASIEEFLDIIEHKYKPSYQFAFALAILLSVSVGVYFQYIKAAPEGPDRNQIYNEVEYKIRLDMHQENIVKLLNEADLSSKWEEDLWYEIQGVRSMLNEDDEWLKSTETTIYNKYLETIRDNIKQLKLSLTRPLIDNAYRYTKDSDELDKQKQQLTEALKTYKAKQQQLVVNEQRQQEFKTQEKSEKKEKVELFDLALNNVNTQLKCQNKINMRNFDTAIQKLRSLDATRYSQSEPQIVKSLAACIEHTGKSFPEWGEEAKHSAARIFKNNRTIADIRIKPRDPCDPAIAGLGARGKRTICKDKLGSAGTGPSLVVMPASGKQPMFAIGKYEVSVTELNLFCKKSSACKEAKNLDESLPATNISFDIVKAYLNWLSKKSDRKYRLPTKSEWLYAAKSRRISLDPNRNCKLSSRGIQKGDELVKVTTGRQNGWGMVNYIGNAQEWVYDKGRKLAAIGASFEDSMDKCDLNIIKAHDGTADIYTGFRVLREVID